MNSTEDRGKEHYPSPYSTKAEKNSASLQSLTQFTPSQVSKCNFGKLLQIMRKYAGFLGSLEFVVQNGMCA